MSEEYLSEVNYYRGIAIIGVLMIHSLGTSSELTLGNFVNVNLTQVSLYSVPFFVFISGLVLAYRYSGKNISYMDFYKRRFNTILIPYLIWSVIYLVYRIVTEQDNITLFLAVKKIIVGSSYFHLYYIVLIMQFYLLFPFMMDFIRRFNKYHLLLLIAAFVLNLMLISAYYFQFDYLNERNVRKIFFMWIFYFVFGSVIGTNLDYYKNAVSRIPLKYIFSLFFIALIALILSYYFDGLLINTNNMFWLRPQVLTYATLSIIVAFRFFSSEDLTNLSSGPFYNIVTSVSGFIAQMGKFSFGIYLCHMIVIKFLLFVFGKLNISGSYFLSDYLLFFVGLLLSLGFVRTIYRLPKGHFLVGFVR